MKNIEDMHPIRYFLHLVKLDQLTMDHRRDFRVLVIACILNFSFAFEKLFIVIGHPMSDKIWLAVYGLFGVFLAYVAAVDFLFDLHEDHVEELEEDMRP